MMRFFKSALFPLMVIVLLLFIFTSIAKGTGLIDRQKLPRLDRYYEITNDGEDHGNFIEQYRIPLPDGRRVFCLVYSDQISDGGGAGISCDWEGSRR
jgi:hypothetical protein